MLLSEFDFQLPDELIAQSPPSVRSSGRLLVVAPDGSLKDKNFKDLPTLARPGDLLVLNNTRVLKARLQASKVDTGGRVEILVERLLSPFSCLVLLRSSNPVRLGVVLRTLSEHLLRVVSHANDFYRVDTLSGVKMDEILRKDGTLPLPPYIQRPALRSDDERYQTIYATAPGAVAAPTAGLHFDTDLLDRLRIANIDLAFLTLHVGAGTFLPIRSEVIEHHLMHREWFRVDQGLVDAIRQTKQRGGRVIAVGTTVVRALETAAQNEELSSFEGDSELFVYPGFRFRVVDLLITNFHLPRSTLLVMVSAFAGTERIRQAYKHAVQQRYQFFSYGDGMILGRADSNHEI